MAVKNITDLDFHNEINASNHVFIKYYADWCGSCRLMAPKVKRLAEDEKHEGINFIEIDAEKKKPRCTEMGRGREFTIFCHRKEWATGRSGIYLQRRKVNGNA